MQPSTVQPVLTNPYATQTVPVVDVQLMLLAALVCLVAGLLLAEQKTLRRILRGVDAIVSPNLVREVA